MQFLLCALFLLFILPAPFASAADTAAVPAPPWAEVRKTRVLRLLPAAMARANVDAWVVVCRENANDPLAVHVGGENVSAPAAFLFLREGEKLRSVALSPEGEAKALRDVGLHDEVVSLPRGTDLYAQVAERLNRAKPRRIALNFSEHMSVADGLSSSQLKLLTAALPAPLRQRLVSSEELVTEWLSIKLPEEVDILRRAAVLTAQLEEEAYRQVVPGKTRDSSPRPAPSTSSHLRRSSSSSPRQADHPPSVRGIGAP